MEPTFQPGDRLMVDPQAYQSEAIRRDDLVVMADPADPERWLLKRVVGIPGDFVRMTHEGIQRRPSRGPRGFDPSDSAVEELEVPFDHVFVLSDRPRRTRDSRQFGPVPKRAVLGRVWRRYFPRVRATEL